MFGYVIVNKPELRIKEFEKYRSYYCGLCHSLKERHGFLGRLTLNYDMTFLIMLLSDLYDKQEENQCRRCMVHPFKCQNQVRSSEITDYCADMCVLLAYYKCMDDWHDEHKLSRKIYASLLHRRVRVIEKQYPEMAGFVEKKMNMLSIVENAQEMPMDKVAKVFGEIMGAVFSYKDDVWKRDLYRIGFYLGKFIYLLDAYEDVERDVKKGAYNPYKEIYKEKDFDKNVLDMLMLMIGECTDSFERLPLLENVEILRNILYSGVWGRYEKAKGEKSKINGSV